MENLINQYLEQFDITAEPSNEFWAIGQENLVAYTLEPNKYDKDFTQNYLNQFPDLRGKLSTFVLSLAHEIGHCLQDLLETESERNYRLDLLYNPNTPIDIYLNLPYEIDANQRGYKFIINNLADLQDLDFQLGNMNPGNELFNIVK